MYMPVPFFRPPYIGSRKKRGGGGWHPPFRFLVPWIYTLRRSKIKARPLDTHVLYQTKPTTIIIVFQQATAIHPFITSPRRNYRAIPRLITPWPNLRRGCRITVFHYLNFMTHSLPTDRPRIGLPPNDTRPPVLLTVISTSAAKDTFYTRAGAAVVAVADGKGTALTRCSQSSIAKGAMTLHADLKWC